MKGKLVRDKIPEIIRNHGEIPRTRILSATEYRQELFRKLVEESSEAQNAKTKKDRVMELADIEEVLATIRDNLQIDKRTIALAQNKKRKERGGFLKRFFLLTTKP